MSFMSIDECVFIIIILIVKKYNIAILVKQIYNMSDKNCLYKFVAQKENPATSKLSVGFLV